MRVRSVIGKRTRLLIEVVRVRFPPDLPGDVRLVHAALLSTLRDRLAGRTLVSETRNAGSTPAPGTKPRMGNHARPTLSENLALTRLVRTLRAGHSFQRSRMVRQPAVNRSSRRFDSSRWSSRPLLSTRRRLFGARGASALELPARADPRAIVPMLLDGRAPASYAV
jgi:hypothetical protein